MNKLIDSLINAISTAVRNAKKNPQTTTAGAASLATGIAILRNPNNPPEIMGAGIAAVLIGIGGLLADDKQNDKATDDNKDR